MLSLLERRHADGVIIHKIDRSARNLKDWADLGELIDRGIEVHLANESLDLHSRGGRLSADIQALVAADYVRNLREETRKGFYGRLKQGLYPLPAPLGYLDCGKGKPKEPDPAQAPLVQTAFEFYATGRYNLRGLVEEMHRRGLRNRRGGKVTCNGLSIALNNPFYIGLIRLRRTGETLSGTHEPLITKSLFDRVQVALSGKIRNKGNVHVLLFRRLFRCRHCGATMIGERQKGHVYYRCQTRTCPTTGIREERVDEQILSVLRSLQLTDQEYDYLRGRLEALKLQWLSDLEQVRNASALRLDKLEDRHAVEMYERVRNDPKAQKTLEALAEMNWAGSRFSQHPCGAPMAEITVRRAGELVRKVFEVLLPDPDGLHPDGLPAKEVLPQVESGLTLSEFERSEYPKHPGAAASSTSCSSRRSPQWRTVKRY